MPTTLEIVGQQRDVQETKRRKYFVVDPHRTLNVINMNVINAFVIHIYNDNSVTWVYDEIFSFELFFSCLFCYK